VDDQAFHRFYDQTSGILAAYLMRSLRDASAVDDVVQDSYYRLLRATVRVDSEEHRRRYLFRIATNLMHNRHRLARRETRLDDCAAHEPRAVGDVCRQTEQRTDIRRAMARLTARERQLVWLAYGQGSTHHEIAGALGLRTGSIKPMLFRARRKMLQSLTFSVRPRGC
jgi:RNA polymerase sigma-70 factor, ECF subfamily